jgi:peptidoglycan/LPS O-acetylase OafA/YrhL
MYGLAVHFGWDGPIWGVALVAVSIAIAAASYRWIESPWLARERPAASPATPDAIPGRTTVT